jgi:sulfite exporter TauE/SafE
MSADLALIASAALMGLAGAPHCAAMCSAPCAGVLRTCGSAGPAGAAMGGLMAARIASYAAGGAVAAGAVAGLQALGAAAPALRIFWTLLHVAALGLGLWLLVTGRQPAWWSRLGTVRLSTPATATAMVPAGVLRQRMPAPARASLIGAAWVLLPCGLLQSALVVAGLASGPAAGAATMAVFAIASAPGLVALPLWLQRGGRGTPVWSLRAAGALLAAASLFALGHGLWLRIAAYCFN